jgi:hypothetical protein
MQETRLKKFTHVGVARETQRKIALLARVRNMSIYELVAGWANNAWNTAISEGLVTETMLQEPAAADTVPA